MNPLRGSLKGPPHNPPEWGLAAPLPPPPVGASTPTTPCAGGNAFPPGPPLGVRAPPLPQGGIYPPLIPPNGATTRFTRNAPPNLIQGGYRHPPTPPLGLSPQPPEGPRFPRAPLAGGISDPPQTPPLGPVRAHRPPEGSALRDHPRGEAVPPDPSAGGAPPNAWKCITALMWRCARVSLLWGLGSVAGSLPIRPEETYSSTSPHKYYDALPRFPQTPRWDFRPMPPREPVPSSSLSKGGAAPLDPPLGPVRAHRPPEGSALRDHPLGKPVPPDPPAGGGRQTPPNPHR